MAAPCNVGRYCVVGRDGQGVNFGLPPCPELGLKGLIRDGRIGGPDGGHGGAESQHRPDALQNDLIGGADFETGGPIKGLQQFPILTLVLGVNEARGQGERGSPSVVRRCG